jgi:hypothetical protein
MEIDIDKFWLLALIIYLAHTFSSVVGIFVIDKLNIDETIFHFTSDLKKMIVCSFLELLAPLLILYTLPLVLNAVIALGILYLLAFWFCTKIAYLHISASEMVVLALVNCAGVALIGWTLIKHFNIVVSGALS